MSKGFVFLAQNSKDDYVLQACLLAMSLKATQQDCNICLITNDDVPVKYKKLFDVIKEIPWTDSAEDKEWKVNNRWKLYHASPYDETIILDTDMLVLQDLENWWAFLKNYDLFFVSNVYTYRGELITSDYYRKTFTVNELPNLYAGFHYFKKSDFAKEFYTWLELVMNNWELFYGQYAKELYQKRLSVDLSASIVAKILNCDKKITNNKTLFPSFTHMKSYIQGWAHGSDRWQDRVGSYLTPDLKLKVGNHMQQGIFHYTEKDFVTHDKIKKYRTWLGV